MLAILLVGGLGLSLFQLGVRGPDLEGRPLAVPDRPPGSMESLRAARSSARLLRDADQQRAILQAMVIFSQDNDDRYPMPSRLDRNGSTIDGPDSAKDTTGNVFAVFIQMGAITPEMLVSPVDRNESISSYEAYQVVEPEAGADPIRALWDPAIRADFTAEGGGHISYAHHLPRGQRWMNTFSFREAVLANRGPAIGEIELRENGQTVTRFADPGSLSLNVFREHETVVPSWTGNTGRNDGAVFLSPKLYGHRAAVSAEMAEPTQPRVGPDGEVREYADVLFADESPHGDAPRAVTERVEGNHWLGIFVESGETRDDFRAIHD
ncbi:MAG: hypothetical protein AAGF47_05005 [Planctomycetota bacterium]